MFWRETRARLRRLLNEHEELYSELTGLLKMGEKHMGVLDQIQAIVTKLEAEIKIAADLIKEQHAEDAALTAVATRLDATLGELKGAVDSVSASDGPATP